MYISFRFSFGFLSVCMFCMRAFEVLPSEKPFLRFRVLSVTRLHFSFWFFIEQASPTEPETPRSTTLPACTDVDALRPPVAQSPSLRLHRKSWILSTVLLSFPYLVTCYTDATAVHHANRRRLLSVCTPLTSLDIHFTSGSHPLHWVPPFLFFFFVFYFVSTSPRRLILFHLRVEHSWYAPFTLGFAFRALEAAQAEIVHI